MEPDYLMPAGLRQPFGAEIDIVLAEEGDRVYACTAIRAVRNHNHFPYPFVTTQVRRAGECGTPLVDAERGGEGMAAILSALSARRRIARSRVLALPAVSQDGPAFEALRTAARIVGLQFIVYESWERGLLKRRPEPGYERLFDAAFRAELRRRRRRLAEELGTEPVLADRTANPAAVERYLRLEGSQGYKSETGGAMATQAGGPEFFGDMCLRFAADGRLHLLALEAGGQTLAMEVWLRGGDGLFLFKNAYDKRYARYGPGVQLQIAAMEHFHAATDASWIDTCTYPDNETLLRLYPDRRLTAGVFVPLSRNPLDRMVISSLMAIRPIHKMIYDKRNP